MVEVEEVTIDQQIEALENQGTEIDPMRASMVITNPNQYSAEYSDNAIFVNAKEMNYKVRNPELFNGYMVYTATGTDSQGTFEVKRRYNEFFLLQDALARRFPGITVPQVPPKKKTGKKEVLFVEERRFFLERFVRKLAHYDFLIESQEFQIFVRPNDVDIQKALKNLPQLSTAQVYERLKECTKVDDKGLQESVMLMDDGRDELNTKITEFQVYIKQA